jgi:predicted RND superfamily exporter protein
MKNKKDEYGSDTAIDNSSKKQGNSDQKPIKSAKNSEEPEYSSSVEKFLAEKIAPELLSKEGRIAILSVYFIMCVCSLYGCLNVGIDFKVEYFISPTAYVFTWFELDKEYF